MNLSVFGAVGMAVVLMGRATAAGPGSVGEDPVFQAIREGNTRAFSAALARPGTAGARDGDGNTPLIVAAQHGDTAMLEALLRAGADVRGTNAAGADALMRGATDPAKVRLLLDRGADARARSGIGNSALMLAARQHGNSGAVRLLLERGADPNATNGFGATALMAAAAAEDEAGVRLLLDHGADVNARPADTLDGFVMGGGRTALMWAAFRGHASLTRLLLARGARLEDRTLIGTALTQAAWGQHAGVTRVLLDAGADVRAADLYANYTALHWAASSEAGSADLVRLLLERGADPRAEGGQPVDGFLGEIQTPLKLAEQRGATPVGEHLWRALGGVPGPGAPRNRPVPTVEGPEVTDDALALGIARAVEPLQRSADVSRSSFLRHASRQDCVSCHQQQLPASAVALARSRGIPVDEDALKRQIDLLFRDAALGREFDLQSLFHPEPVISAGYALLAFRHAGTAMGPAADGYLHHFEVIQGADGRWFHNLPRPPLQSSDLGATALAVHGLRFHATPSRRREQLARVQRAREWMENAVASTAEERAYRLLGLRWADAGGAAIERAVEEVRAEQRPDGGWGQLAGLASDAYATGHALYALLEGGGVRPSDPAVRRGLAFLLRTQLSDGTWHVKRRAFPFQPPMESGYPHGADSWISAAGSSWAVMAMSLALEPGPAGSRALAVTKTAPAERREATAQFEQIAAVDFDRDLRPVLERSCQGCHAGEKPKGGYRVDGAEVLMRGGNRGEPALHPGRPDESLLVQVVTDQVVDLEMPPVSQRGKYPPLTADEVGRLRAWIRGGARVLPDVASSR